MTAPVTPETPSWSRTIYRKCSCGERAFDAKFSLKRGDADADGIWTWLCRNCRAPARDRRGAIRKMREHDRPGSSEMGPG